MSLITVLPNGPYRTPFFTPSAWSNQDFPFNLLLQLNQLLNLHNHEDGGNMFLRLQD
jgi:hypothetical protein